MAEMYVRNCKVPSSLVPADARYRTVGRREKWMIWELLRLAGWTETWKDVDANWTASERLTVADAAVLAANPLQITSATALFQTNNVQFGDLASLEGTLGQNLGMYRIVAVLSETAVLIDPDCAPGDGWLDESGMNLKVHTAAVKSGEQLAEATEVGMTPPSGNLQLRIGSSLTQTLLYGFPKGDNTVKGDGTPTSIVGNFNRGNYSQKPSINAYINDVEAFFYFYYDEAVWHTLLIGELDVPDAADAYPGYLAVGYGTDDAFSLYGTTDLYDVFMLNPTGIGPETHRPGYLGRAAGEVNRETLFNCRLLQGGAPVRRPSVFSLATASPCYFRGKMKTVRSTYTGWEKMRPFDAAGQWAHVASGLLVPRGGPNDPIISEAVDPNDY
jgi:hypothetical protein